MYKLRKMPHKERNKNDQIIKIICGAKDAAYV
jgi:hypothetical protein